MKRLQTTVAVCAITALVWACGDNDANKAVENKPAPEAPVVSAEPAAKKPWTVDRAKFCEDILGPDVVGGVFGTKVVGGARPRGPDQLVECAYRVPGVPDENGKPPSYPALEVTLRVDCRPGTLSVELTRKAVRAAIGSDEKSYRDVNYGKGGGRTGGSMKVGASKIPFFQINFVLSAVPCSVSAIATFWAEDKSEELANMLLERVTVANAPQ